MSKDGKRFLAWGALVLTGLGLVAYLGVAQAANEEEWRLSTLSFKESYHDGEYDGGSGVSTLTIPTGTVAVQASVQAVGGDVRWTVYDAGGPVTGTTGFVLEENEYLELINHDQIESFKWVSDSGNASGATLYETVEGRD